MGRKSKHTKAIEVLIRQRELLQAIIPETAEEAAQKAYDIKCINQSINKLRK